MMEIDGYCRMFVISLRDPVKFERFMGEAAPVAGRYASLERSLTPETVYGAGIDLPDLVNIVRFDSRRALERMEAEAAFQAALPLRSASAEVISIAGNASRGDAGAGPVTDRQYLVEVAQFGADGETAYRAYERQAEEFMAPYGYHVEREIRPDAVEGNLRFRADIVRIGYFDEVMGMQRMHQDPGHERLEGEFYAAAVAESLWLLARPRAALSHPGT